MNIVLTQTQTTYDANSNVILVTTLDRLPTTTGTGPLGDGYGISGLPASVTDRRLLL